MKRLPLILITLFLLGTVNIYAQSEANTETSIENTEVKKECSFTKKANCCKAGQKKYCKGGKKKACCKSKCSKAKNKTYSNDVNQGFSFSKPAKKCGDDCKKSCCASETETTDEEGNSDEIDDAEESSSEE